MAEEIVVASHGHCFDGLASAALFARFHARLSGTTERRYRFLSLGYSPTFSQVPEGWLVGAENAILDFRYTPSDKVTWFFDHHRTGFASEEERAAALSREAGHVHHDGAYPSCARLISDVARERYGIDLSEATDLLAWADRIDTASFASAEEAVRREAPALKLATLIEHKGDTRFYGELAPRLLDRPLEELVADPEIAQRLEPLRREQDLLYARVRHLARLRGRCVTVDLTDVRLEIPAKFYAYAIYPRSLYSVTLTRGRNHFKLSVGWNPWCGEPRAHDIASICLRYGGGGHAAVGAAAFPLADVERAREAFAAVAEELA